ncbi:ABC transporter substrate-binding protein [Acidithiobacillus sp. IBUN Pt1247-S3]|uniref:ABC transporter substrate-binding protein n=1 Tax=Acidithiobacillus sp. IBUN Pt1247-S3 TaxID=3166642 RepID=UPI0034E4EFD0
MKRCIVKWLIFSIFSIFSFSAAFGLADASVAYAKWHGDLNVGAPECAHCLAMALLGPIIDGHKVSFHPFSALSPLVSSLITGRIQIAQVDYPSLVSLASKDVPIVAISGEVNGGSDFVLNSRIKITPNDWNRLRQAIQKLVTGGKTFSIASQYGTVQNVDIRLALVKHGIPLEDVKFINVPFQGMAGALQSYEVDAAVPVQPVAAQITMSHIADHFSYLENQPAGNLTNVVIVTRTFYKAHPALVDHIGSAMVHLVEYIKTPSGRRAWELKIEKYTDFSSAVVKHAMATLVPDYKMPLGKIGVIGVNMFQQGLISRKMDASEMKHYVNYGPLMFATKSSAATLGQQS